MRIMFSLTRHFGVCLGVDQRVGLVCRGAGGVKEPSVSVSQSITIMLCSH